MADFTGYVGRGVGRVEVYRGLKYDCAVIVVLVDMMDGDACLSFTGSDNRFVDSFAIHAFSAELRE